MAALLQRSSNPAVRYPRSPKCKVSNRPHSISSLWFYFIDTSQVRVRLISFAYAIVYSIGVVYGASIFASGTDISAAGGIFHADCGRSSIGIAMAGFFAPRNSLAGGH
ncbi:hypothetical protein HRM2_20760 [Desulforapulum autotrophicum HRM2]|uniref:Uncharacterized protein n=1 Tax=Desulforapulum autotrophicum (strain ATCC 43914 / DSM 3382 / VKM B-1955 / HRM2) TaxID=177437 RepID=C0QCU8_DESAH|nr:hypothetical protein HRM2_20760 [Desulforapulum autotrophicum HRM2]